LPPLGRTKPCVTVNQAGARARSVLRSRLMSERELDCLTCGACCRTGQDGRILVPDADLVRWRRIGREDIARQIQPGHFGEWGFATTAEGACVHLGTHDSANACRIYEDRGTTCREFERGSPQCLEFRRDFGIDVEVGKAATDG
jgi:Fe-S-cluster containining protein